MSPAETPLTEAAALPETPADIPAAVESPQTAILLATAAGVCGLMIGQGIARPLLRLIRTEFCYNTASLCRLLHCERQWVDHTLRPEVEHLFITHYFRQYMLDTCADLTEEERTLVQFPMEWTKSPAE